MTPAGGVIVPAVAGMLVVGGSLALVAGLRRVPDIRGSTRRRGPRGVLSRRTRSLIAVGLVAGVLGWLATGWVLALLLGPLGVVGLPLLLTPAESGERIQRLEALEEWTRSLAGVLTVGVGLEQALVATLRSTPAPISAEVHRLVARLRARWVTEDALRAFADELDDSTGDLVVANLLLGARRRGAGLASVLNGLAESVSADVRARRQIEADRAKPRATARWVTLISASALLILAVSGDYVEPYGTPLGQVVLALLLAAYVSTLVWMRRMAQGRPLPRFLDTQQSPQLATGRSTGRANMQVTT